MAQSDQEKSSYTQMNGEKDHTNEIKHNGTVPKKLLLVTEQWSQEENCVVEDTHPTTNNCHSSFFPEDEAASRNNNFVAEKGNLSGADEKYCFYHKFPLKVNNNVYPEMILVKKDAMEEYFEQNAPRPELSNVANGSKFEQQHQRDDKREKTRENESDNVRDQIVRSGNSLDQINALNGEDEDEDNGCIYTYKGDTNYESNLSQLLDTCFSCGLPISMRAAPICGAVSIQRILNGSSRVKANQNGSLYSPEMDFLEMDFDPGSCGEGADSECEDNNVLDACGQDLREVDSADPQLTAARVDDPLMSTQSGNIQNISSLMCRRCEMCYYNEQKVNNFSDSGLNKSSTKCDISVGIDELVCRKESNGAMSPHSSTVPCSNNYPCNSFRTSNISCDETLPLISNIELRNNADSNTYKITSTISERPELVISNLESRNNYDSNSFPGEQSASAGRARLLEPKQQQNNCDSNSFTGQGGSSSTGEPPSHANISNLQSQHNYDRNSFKPQSSTSITSNLGQLSICDDNVDMESVENNLNFVEEYEKFSDEGGEDADDERDDSVSEPYQSAGGVLTVNAAPVNPLSHATTHDGTGRHSSHVGSPRPPHLVPNATPNVVDGGCRGNGAKTGPDTDVKVCNRSHKIDNNNLGSVSAPEVSPSKEYSCVDKFTRSFSFHNQLSSPKYENVCIASRLHKENIPNCDVNRYAETEDCSCSCTSVSNELEACANRLSQRVKSVFNVEALSCNTKDCYDRVPAVLNSTVEKVMIWTEFQAAYRQVVQVDTSACGATALLNVLLALDESRPIDEVTVVAKTRQRAETAPLVEYLFSRSNAGATHDDLIRGVDEISSGSIASRFFHMFPQRSFQLSRWLSHWIKKGGVPVATLNLQVGVYPLQTIPDAWHHQMVFGVGPLGIYLTNPLECVSVTLLSEQLCSSSVLLVRRADIVSRWDNKDQLIKLSLHSDSRWNESNVLGQVVGVLKEETSPEKFQGRRHLTSHVTIPAAYQSGVTIFMRMDNPNVDELKSMPELPLMDEEML